MQASFSLFTQDCTALHSSNAVVKFADDTTIVGLMSGNDETHNRKEVQHLVGWCSDSNMIINTTKTKEIIVDFSRTRDVTPLPLHINGEKVERVNNIKFLVLHIAKELSWTPNTSSAEAFLLEKTEKNPKKTDFSPSP